MTQSIGFDHVLPKAEASSDMTFCLRMIAGPHVGKTWVLQESPVAVGRGAGCIVRIDDFHVSRVQCELAVDPAGVRMRCTGQRNPTAINGVVREEARLVPGDVISFAGNSLLLDHVYDANETSNDVAADVYTTQTFAEAIHLQPHFDPQAYAQDLTLSGDLHRLVSLMRSLSRVESLDALISKLSDELASRLKSENVWVGWQLHGREDMALYPPATPEETQAAPFHLMRDASRSSAGIMAPAEGARADEYTMAAPLLKGGESFGAVSVRRSSARGAFLHSDLQFLVAVAECCAPLIRAVERLEQLERDSQPIAELKTHPMHMLGDSPVMRALHAEVRRAAIARANVILQGETGVGKELAARMLHDLSARCSGPYVVANCAAISPELFESEMFGHVRGAFTGATNRRRGLFELAQGGTLFLDEITELSLANQAHLLRAVETGAFRPVGSERELKVDVRIVCATNRALPDKEQAYFRNDLYHRLSGIVVRIKPLREHKDDIPALANHFLKLAAPHAPSHPREFSKEAIDKLMAYDWPGNIRELRNVVERACYMAHASYIARNDIHIDSTDPHPATKPEAVSLEDVERLHLLELLRQNGNDAAEVARLLGISRSTVYYKFARHGIKPRRIAK